MKNITVAALYIYPVKSMSGIEVKQIEFDKYGARYDRNWMVIDENGNALTQRQNKQLALFKLTLTDEFIEFSFQNQKFRLEHSVYANNQRILAKVWAFGEELIDCGAEIALFLSDCLKQNCRLVKIDMSYSRRSSGENGSPIALVDSRQLLLTSIESLKWLNDKLVTDGFLPVTMNRFRPNIVLSGGDMAFYENRLQQIELGNVGLRREKACGRCLVITLDQETAEQKDNGPLKILAKHNRDDKKKAAAFGTYFNALNDTGIINLGDTCQIKS